jgi:hypothetical protein
MNGRRELRLALGLCLSGSLLLLWALGRSWLTVVATGELTITGTRVETPGSDLATAARPLAYVGLAAVAAVMATRRWGRVLVGAAVTAAGAGAAVDVAGVLRDRWCLGTCRWFGVEPLTAAGWAWLALLGAVLVAAGGLLVAVRGHGWAGLSSSYEAPGGAAEPPVTDKAVWDALDHGDDPTA